MTPLPMASVLPHTVAFIISHWKHKKTVVPNQRGMEPKAAYRSREHPFW